MNLEISAGVSNIFNSYQSDFDKGPKRDSGYIYGPSLPRCVNIGAFDTHLTPLPSAATYRPEAMRYSVGLWPVRRLN